jgi:hypothetical protein
VTLRSRFADPERAWLSQWYRRLWPALPRDVDEMTPSHVAAVLGLDLEEGTRAVPWSDAPLRVPPPMASPPQQRLRRRVE